MHICYSLNYGGLSAGYGLLGFEGAGVRGAAGAAFDQSRV